MSKTRIQGRANEAKAKTKTRKVTDRESIDENIENDGKTRKRAGTSGSVLRQINDNGRKLKK